MLTPSQRALLRFLLNLKEVLEHLMILLLFLLSFLVTITLFGITFAYLITPEPIDETASESTTLDVRPGVP